MDKKHLQRFIYFFLHNKSLTREQMQMRDRLLARDYYLDSPRYANLPNEKATVHRQGVVDRYVNPQYQQEILRAINQEEVLKYTCHLIDAIETVQHICELTQSESYDFERHAALIKDRFNALIDKYKKENKALSKKMYALVSTYLTGQSKDGDKEKKWSSNNFEENWQCDAIRKWAKENPGVIPNPGGIVIQQQNNSGYRFGKTYKNEHTGKRIIDFSQLVLCFKGMFHIRQDFSAKMLLTRINAELEKQFADKVHITFSNKFLESIELFTDVDKLCQSYKRIIEICVSHQKNGCANIELQFYNNIETKHTYLCIHHRNAIYGKAALNSERIGTQQSALITDLINGVCNLYIKADFEDGSKAEVNLWDAEPIKVQPIEEDVDGVQYILQF